MEYIHRRLQQEEHRSHEVFKQHLKAARRAGQYGSGVTTWQEEEIQRR
jgi:hypothetical protein